MWPNSGGAAAYEAFSQLRGRLRGGGKTADAYQQFTASERSAGFPLLVTRYPVLGRLVAQRVGELAGAVTELLARLHADRSALLAAFWPDGDPGRISAISLGAGDRHRSGRTVARVQFERGLVLAYKPRPVGAERSLHRLVAALGEAGLAGPVTPAVLERDGYGWTGWISRRDCADEAELAGYYRRAGALLALAWLLGSCDLHVENIVAAGPAPAVVDAEMMSPPRPLAEAPVSAGQTAADAEIASRLQRSVAATGLLPGWVGTRPDNAHDVAGLTGGHPGGEPVWAYLNTADMVPVVDPLAIRRLANAPSAGDSATVAASHLPDLIKGYDAADRWLGRRPGFVAGLVERSGLLRASARFTVRSTMAYASIMARAGRPALLSDGLERSLALDAVNHRPWWPPLLTGLHASDPAAARRIAAAERRALERGDVPLFLASPADRDLVTECGPVTGVFRGAPMAGLRDRIGQAGHGNRQEQILCLRGTFEGHWRASPRQPVPPAAGRPPSAGALGNAARRLASGVARRAVRAGGSVSWLILQENEYTLRPGLAPAGLSLYSGRAGLAVFLAAGAVHCGDGELARLARDCARPISGLVRAAGVEQLGGALSGTASAVYGLALTADLLGDPALAGDACQAAAHLAASTADPASFGPPPWASAGDVSGGLVGAALALCGAARHGAGPAAAAAVNVAERALAADLTGPVSMGVVDGDDPGWRTGVAHGLAGAALALHRVSAVAGGNGFAAAATAMADAAGVALAETDAAGRRLGRHWCRGTAGIAAAAIAIGGRHDSPSWLRGLGQASERAHHRDPLTDASVCCGRGGEIELLTLAGEQRAAQELAMTVIPAAGQDWALGHWPGIVPLLLGFHRGVAGLGYTFLRALAPGRLPSVLVWE